MDKAWRIERADTIPSTMDWVREHALDDWHGVVATTQSGGRGRLGRQWESPAGNLYFSFLLKSVTTPLLPLALALAVHDTVRSVVGTAPDMAVKWPNDVLVDNKKVAGILIEAHADAQIVGIGMNVAVAPEGKACLCHYASCDVEGVLARLMRDIRHWAAIGAVEITTAWNDRAAFKGQTISFRHGRDTKRGVFMGVDADGQARIAIDGAEKSFASVEIMEVRPCC